MNTEIQSLLADLTSGVGNIRTEFERRLSAEVTAREELALKLDRQRWGGPAPGGSEGTTASRAVLASAIKALVAGDQGKADQHLVEYKAMSVAIGSDGGYLCPPEIVTSMTRVMAETSPILELPRVIELKHGDRFEEPIDRNTAGASWTGETTSRTVTATPQLGLLEIPVHEIYALPSLTQKLIDTASIDVVCWLSDKLGESFGAAEASAFVSGDGVARPRGFLTYPTAATADATRAWGTVEHVVTGASGGFKAAASDPADCLIDLVSKLKSQYRKDAKFLMNRTSEAAVRKLKDSQGRFLLVDSLVAGQPSTLLGYPVVLVEQMPDPAANSLSIAFGNLAKGYTVARRLGLKLLTDPYTSKPNVLIYGYRRVGGAVNNFEAIKLLKFST